jgi:hypothetical protein
MRVTFSGRRKHAVTIALTRAETRQFMSSPEAVAAIREMVDSARRMTGDSACVTPPR